MKKTFALVVVAALLLQLDAFAGARLVKGNLSFLKGAGNVKVEFDYKGVRVGEFKNEDDYVAKKVKEYNAKEAGRGDRWKDAWFDDRPTRFEPKFLELINEHSDKTGLKFEKDIESKYVMVVKTTFLEPGWNVGVMKKPAYTDYMVYFYDASDTERKTPLAQIELKGMPGASFFGADIDTGVRIAESYAKAGKELAQFYEKNMKK